MKSTHLQTAAVFGMSPLLDYGVEEPVVHPLSKRFTTGIASLDYQLNGGIREGSMVAVVGPRRSGKSTFIRTMYFAQESRSTRIRDKHSGEYDQLEMQRVKVATGWDTSLVLHEDFHYQDIEWDVRRRMLSNHKWVGVYSVFCPVPVLDFVEGSVREHADIIFGIETHGELRNWATIHILKSTERLLDPDRLRFRVFYEPPFGEHNYPQTTLAERHHVVERPNEML